MNVTLYYVELDDGTYLYTDKYHESHAYYFFSREMAHLAGEGFTKAVKDEYGFDITYKIKTRESEMEEAVGLVVGLMKRLGAFD